MGETDPAFQLNSRKPTAGETLPYSARFAALGVLLGLAPSAYRRLRYGKRDSGNTLGRTALEAGVGATMLGALPWLARSRFKYSVPGVTPWQPKPGETQEAFDERTRIKSWGDVDDRLFIPRADKKAAFRKVAQAAAARQRNPRNAEEISALFRQHYTPEQLNSAKWEELARNAAATREHQTRISDPYYRNKFKANDLGQIGGTIQRVGEGYNTARNIFLYGMSAPLTTAYPLLATTANLVYKGFGANQLRKAVGSGYDAYQLYQHDPALSPEENVKNRHAADYRRQQALGELASGALAFTPFKGPTSTLGKIPGVRQVSQLASRLPAGVQAAAAPIAQQLGTGINLAPAITAYGYAGANERHADRIDSASLAEYLSRARGGVAPAAAATGATPAGPTLANLTTQRGGN